MVGNDDKLLLEEKKDVELPDIELSRKVLNRLYNLGFRDAVLGKFRKQKNQLLRCEYQKGFNDGKKH